MTKDIIVSVSISVRVRVSVSVSVVYDVIHQNLSSAVDEQWNSDKCGSTCSIGAHSAVHDSECKGRARAALLRSCDWWGVTLRF